MLVMVKMGLGLEFWGWDFFEGICLLFFDKN